MLYMVTTAVRAHPLKGPQQHLFQMWMEVITGLFAAEAARARAADKFPLANASQASTELLISTLHREKNSSFDMNRLTDAQPN